MVASTCGHNPTSHILKGEASTMEGAGRGAKTELIPANRVFLAQTDRTFLTFFPVVHNKFAN